ncbi:MAG: PRC-barrel domain-containing protein [Nitrospinae bacterium]|nr:PRC-barrel domain-containing protein [Nitrospinota bacterium]
MIRAFQNNVVLPFEWRLQRYEVFDARGKSVSLVLDLLYDEKEKAVRYVITEIGGGVGVSGKRVLLPVEIVERAGNGILQCEVEEKRLMDLPPLENRENPTRKDEQRIYEHFEKTPYWEAQPEQPEQTAQPEGDEASRQAKPKAKAEEPPLNLELDKDWKSKQ